MGDYLVRATAANNSIRAFAINATNMVEEARNIHQTLPVMTAALGRVLCAGAMMGSMMKGEKDVLTIQYRCDGPAGGITVTADGQGNVKGYCVNPAVDIPLKYKGKLDVGSAIGNGVLSVSMDLGLREPYNGQVEIQTGEIGDDLAYYFTVSEQTPSAVGLGVKVDTDCSVMVAGGFIIQLMPFASEQTIAGLEKRLAEIEPVTTMLEKGMTPEEILTEILGDIEGGFDYSQADFVYDADAPEDQAISEAAALEEEETAAGVDFYDRRDVKFQCDCSKERVSRALSTLGKKDLDDIIADGESIEVKCYFCNKAYNFDLADLEQIRAIGLGESAESTAE